jgi:hypothetical protein
VAPKSTLENWAKEFDMWTERSKEELKKDESDEEEFKPSIQTYVPSRVSTFQQRKELVERWMEYGGVMLLSYQMYTRMVGELVGKVLYSIFDGSTSYLVVQAKKKHYYICEWT